MTQPRGGTGPPAAKTAWASLWPPSLSGLSIQGQKNPLTRSHQQGHRGGRAHAGLLGNQRRGARRVESEGRKDAGAGPRARSEAKEVHRGAGRKTGRRASGRALRGRRDGLPAPCRARKGREWVRDSWTPGPPTAARKSNQARHPSAGQRVRKSWSVHTAGCLAALRE